MCAPRLVSRRSGAARGEPGEALPPLSVQACDVRPAIGDELGTMDPVVAYQYTDILEESGRHTVDRGRRKKVAMSADSLVHLCVVVGTIQGLVFLGYVVAILVPFVRRKRRPLGNPADFEWHVVIPCRDEEAVIGDTIAYLRSTFPHAHAWVVDDDSEDTTGEIVRAWAERDPFVHLVQRRRPDARKGKAHALNHAWALLLDELGPDADLSRVILCVVDADGRPSANLLEVCAGEHLFGDDRIAAVQVEVRMSNRTEETPFADAGRVRNLLGRTFVRMQDLEFRGPISAIQMSRKYTGTVNVGGNGQLARMSALVDIADERGPWRGSLLEDFELGLHLLLGGWLNGYTADAWVDQEALYSPRRYVTQRARWAQGTMQCLRYLGKVWGSPRLTNAGAMEVTYFLLQPWMQIVGTLVGVVPVVAWVVSLVSSGPTLLATPTAAAAVVACWLVGVAEFAVWGFLYRRHSEPEAGRMAALGWGLSYVVYVYGVYVVAWKAFVQVLRRQTAWAKTVRNAEAAGARQLVARLH